MKSRRPFITVSRGRWHAYMSRRRRVLMFHTWSEETLRWALTEVGARRR